MGAMANVSELHTRHHDDYETAKREIHQSLGSIEDIEVFGRQVLVACYVRPAKGANGLYATVKTQTEDVYMGKAVLILKCGPDAFQGDDGFKAAMFGDMPVPAAGDWMFVRPQDGVGVNLCGDGASRPKGEDFRGNQIDLYEWDGWPCRMISDDAFLGRMNKPHEVV
jgi:hypothetical protein